MSHETNTALSTPAQSAPTAQPHPWDAAADEQTKSLERWLCVTRWVSTAIVLVLLVVVPLGVMGVLGDFEQERGKRVCGVDWILWAVGSERTFESSILEAIENSRENSPFPDSDAEPLIKPFEFNAEGFNLSDGILYKPNE
jgi:hypothetical protein